MYDRFAINGSSQFLINTRLFPNPSAALGAQLVEQQHLLRRTERGGGQRRRSRAGCTRRDPFAGRVQLLPLDESTFPAGNINSLMTPQLGAGEAIHDTGPITRGLFTDSGWGVVSSCSYSLSSAIA